VLDYGVTNTQLIHTKKPILEKPTQKKDELSMLLTAVPSIFVTHYLTQAYQPLSLTGIDSE